MPSAESDIVIRTEGLTKRFGRVCAVDSLDLTVRRGQIYGFLGRNGAGKTTTIRMMLALTKPSAGHVEVLGQRMKPNAVRAFERIGSVLENAGSYGNLPCSRTSRCSGTCSALHAATGSTRSSRCATWAST